MKPASKKKSAPVLGRLIRSKTGKALDTGFDEFYTREFQMRGLARINGRTLEILAIVSDQPNCGHFRKFIAAAQKNYLEICFWDVISPVLFAGLPRYGFKLTQRVPPFGRRPMECFVWQEGNGLYCVQCGHDPAKSAFSTSIDEQGLCDYCREEKTMIDQTIPAPDLGSAETAYHLGEINAEQLALERANYWHHQFLVAARRFAESRALLVGCADTFRAYERIHLAKGTEEGRRKAGQNADWAQKIEQFLSRV